MPSWLILLLAAIAAVALFVVGMSLTLMFKGHFIDSEISTNKNMQRLGIKCAVQDGSGLTAKEAAAELAEQLNAEVVQSIGNRFVLFRRSRRDDVEHIRLVRE